VDLFIDYRVWETSGNKWSDYELKVDGNTVDGTASGLNGTWSGTAERVWVWYDQDSSSRFNMEVSIDVDLNASASVSASVTEQ
jgi:hypothetical protein